MMSSSLFRRHKGEEAEKTILAYTFIKSLFVSSPLRGRFKGLGGNRNPPTLFAILALKMALAFEPLQKKPQQRII